MMLNLIFASNFDELCIIWKSKWNLVHTAPEKLEKNIPLRQCWHFLLGLLSDANYNIPLARQWSGKHCICTAMQLILFFSLMKYKSFSFACLPFYEVCVFGLDWSRRAYHLQSSVWFPQLSDSLFAQFFALSMSVASSLTHSSFNSSATSKTLSLRRLTGIGFDPRFILFWRLVTESSH